MAVIAPAWGAPGFGHEADVEAPTAAERTTTADPRSIRVLLVMDYGFAYATARAAFETARGGVFHVSPAAVARTVAKGQTPASAEAIEGWRASR